MSIPPEHPAFFARTTIRPAPSCSHTSRAFGTLGLLVTGSPGWTTKTQQNRASLPALRATRGDGFFPSASAPRQSYQRGTGIRTKGRSRLSGHAAPSSGHHAVPACSEQRGLCGNRRTMKSVYQREGRERGIPGRVENVPEISIENMLSNHDSSRAHLPFFLSTPGWNTALTENRRDPPPLHTRWPPCGGRAPPRFPRLRPRR